LGGDPIETVSEQLQHRILLAISQCFGKACFPMNSQSKRKAIIYKKAVFTKPSGATLQELLKCALDKKKKVVSRREDPQGDGLYFRLINYFGMHGLKGATANMLGSELLAYEPKADASAVEIDPNATRLAVNSVHPPQKNQEFLDGTVYFGVLGNHLVILQSRSLRTIDLEHHINWLLRNVKDSLFDSENYVGLSDQEPKSKKAMFKDVRGVKVSGPVQFKSASPGTKEKTAMLIPTGNAWAAVKAFLGDAVDFPKELDADEILNSGHLMVSLFLKWTSRDPEACSELMSNIGYNMRHIDNEIEYSVETRTGEIKKDEFKLKTPINIVWKPDSGQPSFDDLFPKMLEWLDTLASEDKIDV